MNTFFRIQLPTGEGIYRNLISETKYPEDFNDDSRHPRPACDSLLKANAPELFDADYGWFTGSEWIFGFSSLAQLRSWIYRDSHIQFFHELGFELLEMSGDIRAGNAQAIIFQPTATVLSTKSLLTLLPPQ